MAENRSIGFQFPRSICLFVGSTIFGKGKTMTKNSAIHVIWDFPVMLFNKGREKIRQLAAAREKEDARWLNG